MRASSFQGRGHSVASEQVHNYRQSQLQNTTILFGKASATSRMARLVRSKKK